MGSSWLLKLALNCIDHLAWPLLALGYPLCASVHAIETDSYSETRDLMSYWILLSLIYLFEYAFLRLLSWFQFWPYIKLMIIFWLIIPEFGRASHVYNNLIRSCITLNPQAVISRLKNWRKLFVKKENFLLHAERYIQENGTEALEKLIAGKITTHNIGAEATNTIKAIDKKETQQITTQNIGEEATNTIRATDKKDTQQITTHNIGAEATNTIRATDKKETQQITLQNIGAEATNTVRATDTKDTQRITTHNIGAEATNTIRATDKKETQEITTHNIGAEATNTIRATDKKETQEITTQTIGAEATNAVRATDKKDTQQVTTHNIGAEATTTIRATDKKETQEITTQTIGAEATNTVRATDKKDTQQITTHNVGAEATNTIRATDKKESQEIMTQTIGAKATNTVRATDKKDTQQISTHNIGAEATNTIGATDKKETQQITTQNIGAEATNTDRATDKKDTQQTTTHSIGVEATDTIRATDKKETQEIITTHHISAEATNTIRAIDKKETQQTNENKIQKEHRDIKAVEMIEKKEISAGKQDIHIMPNPSLNQNISSATKETNGMAKKGAAGGELPQSSTHKEVQKEWTCAVCQVTTSCEKNLIMHLNGRLHKATCEALNAKNHPSPQKMKNDQSKEELKQKNFINQPANGEQKNIQFSQVKEQAQTSREPEKRMLNDPVKQSNIKGKKNNSPSDQKGVMMNESKLRCEACNVSCTSEVDLASHMKGKRHLAKMQTCSQA